MGCGEMGLLWQGVVWRGGGGGAMHKSETSPRSCPCAGSVPKWNLKHQEIMQTVFCISLWWIILRRQPASKP